MVLVFFIAFMVVASSYIALEIYAETSPHQLSHLIVGQTSKLVFDPGPNSSEWVILEGQSTPIGVIANDTGTIPQYSTLSGLNYTKIGIYCIAINSTYPSTGVCTDFQQYTQTGWYWDSVNSLLYIHYEGQATNTQLTVDWSSTNTSSSVQNGGAQVGPPFLVATPIQVSGSTTAYVSKLQIINNQSDLEASLSSLNFSAPSGFSVSFNNASLPIGVLPFQTVSLNLNVTVRPNLSAGKYFINGTATVVETGSNGVASNYNIDFSIPVMSGQGGGCSYLCIISSYKNWIMAAALVVVLLAAVIIHKRRED